VGCEHLVGERGHLAPVRDVDDVGGQPLARAGEAGGLREACLVEVDGCHAGASLHETEDHLAADPAAAAGDDEDLGVDLHVLAP